MSPKQHPASSRISYNNYLYTELLQQLCLHPHLSNTSAASLAQRNTCADLYCYTPLQYSNCPKPWFLLSPPPARSWKGFREVVPISWLFVSCISLVDFASSAYVLEAEDFGRLIQRLSFVPLVLKSIWVL